MITEFYDNISTAKKAIVEKMKKQAALEYLVSCEKQLEDFKLLTKETREMELGFTETKILEHCEKLTASIDDIFQQAKNKLA